MRAASNAAPSDTVAELRDLLPYLTSDELSAIDVLLTDIPLTFAAFIRLVAPKVVFYPHVAQLVDVLQRVADGELKRVMIFMPPRHGKSELASRLFPAYWLYRHPTQYVGLASYGASLAYMLSRAARENYLRAGGALTVAGVEEWLTPQGGGMWSAGVGGAITGKGFSCGIIDDPVKNAEDAASPTIRANQKEWWKSTLYTRLEPNAAIICIGTRWHQDDLMGWLLTQEADQDTEPERWHIISMPAIAEPLPPLPPTCTVEPDPRIAGEPLCAERYSLARLTKIRGAVGEGVWSALYQQRPQRADGNIFHRTWWDDPTARFHLGDRYIVNKVIARWQFWDTALKDKESNDFAACLTLELWPDYRLAVRRMWCERVQSYLLPDLMQEQATAANFDGKLRAVVVEDKGGGTTAIQTLRATAPAWLANMIQEFEPTGTWWTRLAWGLFT